MATPSSLVPVLLRPRPLPARVTVRRSLPEGHAVAILFGLLATFYLATSTGHLTSGDENQFALMVQSLFQPHGLAALWARNAVGYGVLQPLLGMPLWAMGSLLARFAQPQYAGVIERFAVTALTALATAGTAALLAQIALELGVPLRAAAGLALMYGLGTIAWPYARSFWSEPLGALLLTACCLVAIRSRSRRPLPHWAAVGLLLIACAASRPVILLAAGPLAAYLLAVAIAQRRRHGAWRWGGQAAAGLALGAGLPLLLVLAVNTLHTGNPLSTAAGAGSSLTLPATLRTIFAGSNPAQGVYGLLLSSGKGLFWYSPLCIAALFALPAFIRRWPAEALLTLSLVAAFLLFHGSTWLWTGDAAWGPRYLVRIIPFTVLPLLAWSGAGPTPATRRLLVCALFGAGIAVQLASMSVPFQAYFSATGDNSGGSARLFNPVDSAIVGHLRLFETRLARYNPLPLAIPPYPVKSAGEMTFEAGWEQSTRPNAVYPRWIGGHASILFATASSAPAAVRLELQPLPHATTLQAGLQLVLDGAPLNPAAWHVSAAGGADSLLAALPALNPGQHRLEILTTVPAGPPPSAGLQVPALIDDLAIYQDGQPYSIKVPSTILPLPVSPQEPWSTAAYGWFNDGRQPHTFDWWPWYAVFSGLPAWWALFVLVPGGLAAVAGLQLVRRLGGPPRREAALTLAGCAATLALLTLTAIATRSTVLKPFPITDPTSPPGTWAVLADQARVLAIPSGSTQTAVQISWYDDAKPPIVINRQVAGQWQYAAYVLPRTGSGRWLSTTLNLGQVPAGGETLSFVSSDAALLRPPAIAGSRS